MGSENPEPEHCHIQVAEPAEHDIPVIDMRY
jgi:hypothetical protein